MTVQLEKGHHRPKADALVAIDIRVILHEPKRVGRSEYWDLGRLSVMPLVLRTRER